MASATPCTGCYPGWPHSYPETQRDWILRFWTRGHRPDSQLLYENFEQVTHAEALKRKAALEALSAAEKVARERNGNASALIRPQIGGK